MPAASVPDDGVDVTIAVITHNSGGVLPDFFASLPAGIEGVERCEVVVVDSGSTDDTLSVVAQHAPAARVVDLGANLGYAAGINAAAVAVPSRVAVLACNADVRFRPGALRRMLHALAQPGVGIVVPREMRPMGVRDDSLRREPTVLRTACDALMGGGLAGRLGLGEAVVGDDRYRCERTADWASGAVQLMSRACLAATGPWDESFFLYSEETDFDLRARDAGFRLRYVPDAVIDHEGGDMNSSAQLWSLRAVNRVLLYERRHGRARGRAFLAVATLHELLRSRRAPVHSAAAKALLRYARTGRRSVAVGLDLRP